MPITISSFYKFVTIEDPLSLRETLLGALAAHGLRGTILLATEGINGTISGAPADIAAFLVALRADPRFADLTTKDASAETHPFRRTFVKVKREIIRFDQPSADPAVQSGTSIAPKDWNALISSPDVVLIDTRNAYEVAEGTFTGALDPKTRRFGDLPSYLANALNRVRHKRVAMFCTGGIRCEKASAYLKGLGFAEVYQLRGGVLAYLAEVPEDQSLWQGKCYVFDERGVVG